MDLNRNERAEGEKSAWMLTSASAGGLYGANTMFATGSQVQDGPIVS